MRCGRVNKDRRHTARRGSSRTLRDSPAAEYFATLGASALFGTAEKPTNIILILADDLECGDLGCYGQGWIRTPHLARLATEGMRFTQAYANSAVCAPSRCALMTAFHGGHGRVRDNLPHGIFLQPDDVTVAELLKGAGYRTAGFSKWSLGNPGTWGLPWMQGFDEWFGYLDQDHAQSKLPPAERVALASLPEGGVGLRKGPSAHEIEQ